MKKIISIVLALVLVLAMATAVSADTTETTEATIPSGTFDQSGVITINKYNKNNVYSVYLMLELESYNTAGKGSYSYVVRDAWEDFFTTGEGAPYVTFKGDYVSWNTAKADSEAVIFAEKALKYAKAENITPDAVTDAANTAAQGTTDDGYPTYTIDNLWLGYYLVDSTMGSLCGLTTTNPHASVNAKNGEPTIVKHVQENSNSQWGSANTAGIGDTVNYRITITTQPGAENYVVHDDLADTLHFNADSVTVEYDGAPVDAANYEVKTDNLTDTCDFEVIFKETFLEGLGAGKSLIIYYTAVLDKDAIIAGDGNTNAAKLAFGDDHESAPSQVTTKTFAFDLVKTDAQNTLLDGASFKMLRPVDGGMEEVRLVKVVDGVNGTFYYRPALSTETEVVADNEFEVEGGIIRFQGFDPGDYYFQETEAPDGYNILTAPAHFTLSDLNKDAIFNSGIYSSGSGFHITNQSGTMLPETGGLGTLLFTVLGGGTALGTGVVLVTKKRMSKIEDEE